MGNIDDFKRFRIWAGLAALAIYLFLIATGKS